MTHQDNEQLQQLFDHLDLETIDCDLYRTRHKNEGWKQVYGGQVLAQALLCSSCTVADEFQPHSLHAYFLRPGNMKEPIIYSVDRSRDGRSFTTRRVLAKQRGEVIFIMSASFHKTEPGLSHQIEMPEAPPPSECLTRQQVAECFRDELPVEMLQRLSRPFAIDLRPIAPDNILSPCKGEPRRSFWMKLDATLPEDYALHSHMLAYASDMTLLETSLIPHGLSMFNPQLQMASLDHSMWFHRPFRMDEWLLYVQDSPASAGARGFSRGSFFTQAGELVASVAQEGLIRLHD